MDTFKLLISILISVGLSSVVTYSLLNKPADEITARKIFLTNQAGEVSYLMQVEEVDRPDKTCQAQEHKACFEALEITSLHENLHIQLTDKNPPNTTNTEGLHLSTKNLAFHNGLSGENERFSQLGIDNLSASGHFEMDFSKELKIRYGSEQLFNGEKPPEKQYALAYYLTQLPH